MPIRLLIIALAAVASQGCTMFVRVPPLEPLPQPRTLLYNVLYTPQQESWDCGPACVATVIRYCGSPLTLDQVTASLKQIDRGGTVPQEIIFFCRKNGFKITYLQDKDINWLRRELLDGKPVILFLHPMPDITKVTPWRRGHYAVAVGFDDVEREFVLHTGTESFDTMSYRRLQLQWSRSRFAALLIEK